MDPSSIAPCPDPESASTAADPSAATPGSPKPLAAARSRPDVTAELEGRTRFIFQKFNERDWDGLESDGPSVASDFKAVFTGGGTPFNYEEMTQYQRQVTQASPDYRLDVLTTSVDLDKAATYAKVFVLCEVTRARDSLRGENTCVVEFRKADEEWKWCRLTNIRAPTSIGFNDPIRAR